jgi:hypothetical protein
VRWAARVADIPGTIGIIADGGVIATFTEPIFCAAAEGVGKYPTGEHGSVVQITVRDPILSHGTWMLGKAPGLSLRKGNDGEVIVATRLRNGRLGYHLPHICHSPRALGWTRVTLSSLPARAEWVRSTAPAIVAAPP